MATMNLTHYMGSDRQNRSACTVAPLVIIHGQSLIDFQICYSHKIEFANTKAPSTRIRIFLKTDLFYPCWASVHTETAFSVTKNELLENALQSGSF